jgi:methionyl-tRNA formyltransferase
MTNHPKKQWRVALMMTEENPAGREYLKAIFDVGILPVAIIVEYSKAARQSLEYNTQRMGGQYEPPRTVDLLHGRDIPVYLTKSHSSPECNALVQRLSLDFVVAGGVGGILRKGTLQIPELGFIGCHPGLLPKMRGSNPIIQAILNDHPLGATCFQMDEGIDTGPIIYKETFEVHSGDSYEMIEAAMLQHCGHVLRVGLEMLLNGFRDFVVQRPEDGTEFKRATPEMLTAARQKLADRSYAFYAS